MILQLRHICLTDAETFMVCSLAYSLMLKTRPGTYKSSLRPEHDASTTQIVRGQFNGHLVAGEDADVVHAHLAGNVTEHDVPVFQLHSKRSVRKILQNLALHLND